MLTVYGIKNCDTMKKTFAWLDERSIPYQFHDYKKQGLDATTLQHWLDEFGWQGLINQKGTTWRKLALDKNSLDNHIALPIMLANLSMVKRPILQSATGRAIIGFLPAEWQHVV